MKRIKTLKAQEVKDELEENFFNKGRCFIIAEAGVNHNGNIKLAEKMVYAAAKTGVDAIKFQTFKAEQVTIKSSETAAYQKANTGEKNQYELLRCIELPENAYSRLFKVCQKAGIMFMSTPHGHIISAQLLKPYIKIWKVGSGDLTNIPFLTYLGQTKKQIILSTGMATIKEIKKAVSTIEATGNHKIGILHCTTNYPCPDKEANILAMLTIKKHFPRYQVGFSDHTEGIIAPIIATVLGARVIEKHFTLDRSLSGPDQKNSLEPDELKAMVKGIRRTAVLIGSREKQPLKSELIIAQMVRKSVVSAQRIPAGKVITKEMLTIKRPAKDGLSPERMLEIIGKTAKRDIERDQQIKKGDF